MPNNIIGDGTDLSVLAYSRGLQQFLAELPVQRGLTSGSFTRTLDNTSTCDFEIALSAESEVAIDCQEYKNIRTWATDIVVLRDGEVQWSGPLTNRTDNPNTISLSAQDYSVWWDRTLIPAMNFVDEDPAFIFERMHEESFRNDRILFDAIKLFVERTGQSASREVLGEDYEFLGDKLRELSSTGVDWTAYGQHIFVGGSHLGGDPIYIGIEDWVTPPSINESGLERATHVVVRGNGELVAEAEDPEYVDFYGRITRVFDEPDILDQKSLNLAAQTRLDLLKDPVFINASAQAQLSPTANLRVSDLIPGTHVHLGGLPLCRETHVEFRLSNVTVNFSGQVTVGLQPLGYDITGL